MNFSQWQFARVLTISLLIALLIGSPVQAQHVVSPADLQKEMVTATQTRQSNLEKATKLFSSETAEKGLRSARMDPVRVKAAIATLSDAELAQLASRADRVENDFSAGQLSNRDLLLIIIGIAVVILIIVAVD